MNVAACRRACGLLLLLAGLAAPLGALGHEVRPAYLQLTEIAPGEFEVLWKQPVLGDRRLPLTPVLPADCRETTQLRAEHTGAALIERWRVACSLTEGSLRIDGLSRTLTDVMVRVAYADGTELMQLLRPESASLDLADPAPPVWDYLRLGVDHLLFGIDHILFVIGLVLFIHAPLELLKTITAFTLAHSITLAASVLDLVALPQQPVEAVIALSILFLARELVLPETRRSHLTLGRPWLVAMAFGLLHGFGFAGALRDVGLPRDQLALSLALFNVGIEIGQLLVVAAMLALGWLAGRLIAGGTAPGSARAGLAGVTPGVSSHAIAWPAAWRHGCAWLMGAVAAYWTIDRVLLVL
jgi:hydrogenase/urease accessory protein HupE